MNEWLLYKQIQILIVLILKSKLMTHSSIASIFHLCALAMKCDIFGMFLGHFYIFNKILNAFEYLPPKAPLMKLAKSLFS